MPKMIERGTWDDFRAVGLLWWVNRMLHLFGWAIVVEMDGDNVVTDAYPARCHFRGFDEDSEGEGFQRLTEHMAEKADALLNDVKADFCRDPQSHPLTGRLRDK